MLSMIRPSAFALALVTLLGLQGLGQAGYTYQVGLQGVSGPSPLTYKSPDSSTVVTISAVHSIFSPPAGPNPIDGSPQTITIYDFHATSTSNTPMAIVGTPMSLLYLYDGTQTGTISIVGFLGGSVGIGTSGLTYQPNSSGGSTTVNGNTYTLSNFVYTAPVTNGADGSLTATLVASPGVVPEPSSLVLMSLGGVALLAARRFRKGTRRGFASTSIGC